MCNCSYISYSHLKQLGIITRITMLLKKLLRAYNVCCKRSRFNFFFVNCAFLLASTLSVNLCYLAQALWFHFIWLCCSLFNSVGEPTVYVNKIVCELYCVY